MNAENKHWLLVDRACRTLCDLHEDLACPMYSSDFDDSYVILLDPGTTPRKDIIEEFTTVLLGLGVDNFDIADCTCGFLVVDFS